MFSAALLLPPVCPASLLTESLLDVQQKSPVKYRAAPMFTLHQINAYEDNGFLVMDMCCGDDGVVIGEFTLENLRRESGQAMDEVCEFSNGGQF